jgi:type II secretory pathway component PulC
MFCLAENGNLIASEIVHQKKSNHDGPRLVENPAAVAGTAAESVAGLEATALDIVLMGIVDGRHQDRRAVILTKKDRSQQMYQTGDMVAGALIKNISRSGVILRVNGRDEILDMSEAGNFRSKNVAGPVSVSVRPQAQVEKIDARYESGEHSEQQIPVRTRIVLPVEEVVETPSDNGGS